MRDIEKQPSCERSKNMNVQLKEKRALINNVLGDGRLFYLYDRWQDEKEYEDFADYIEQVKNLIEGFGLVFIKMTKGFKVAIRHIDTLVEIKITKSGANVTFKQQAH
tara:strand:- start:156 stop:476 length:321 start_codon:yes stop_codon:yes gene_type:complete